VWCTQRGVPCSQGIFLNSSPDLTIIPKCTGKVTSTEEPYCIERPPLLIGLCCWKTVLKTLLSDEAIHFFQPCRQIAERRNLLGVTLDLGDCQHTSGSCPGRSEARIFVMQLDLTDLVEGAILTGEVVSLMLNYGVQVDLGAQYDGYLPHPPVLDNRLLGGIDCVAFKI